MSGKHPLSSNQVEVKWEILICVLVFYVTWILFQAVRQRDMLGLRRLTSKLFSSSQTADNNTNSTDKTTQNVTDKPPPLRREKTLPVSSSAPQTSASPASNSTSQITSESPKERTKTIKRRAPQPLRQSQSSSVLTSLVGSKVEVKNAAGNSSENLSHTKRKAPQPVKQSQSSSALSSQVTPTASELEEALTLISKVDTKLDFKVSENEKIKQTILSKENEPIIPQTVINFEEKTQSDANTNLNEKNISGEAASPENKTTNDDEKTTKTKNKNLSLAGVKKKSNEPQDITKKPIKNENSENTTKNSNAVLHDEIKHVFQFQINRSKSQIELKKKTEPPPSTFPTVLSDIVTPVNGSNKNGANADVPHITQEDSLDATTDNSDDTTQVKTEDKLTDACEITIESGTKREFVSTLNTLTTSLGECCDSSVKIKTHIDSLAENSCTNDETDSKTALPPCNATLANGHNNLENKIECLENKNVSKKNDEVHETHNVNAFVAKSDTSTPEKKEIELDNTVEVKSQNILNEFDHHDIKIVTAAASVTKLENVSCKKSVNDVVKSIDRPVQLAPVNVSNNETMPDKDEVKPTDKILNMVDCSAQSVAETENTTKPKKLDVKKLSVASKKSINDAPEPPINVELEIKTAEAKVKSPGKILNDSDVVSETEDASKLEKLDSKKFCNGSENSCNYNQALLKEGSEIKTATQVKSTDKILINRSIKNVSDTDNVANPEKTNSKKLVTQVKKPINNHLAPVKEGNEIEIAAATENSTVKILKTVNLLDQHETTLEKTVDPEKHLNKTKKSDENKESCSISLEQVNVGLNLNTAQVSIDIKSPAKILNNVHLSEKSNLKPEKTLDPEKHHEITKKSTEKKDMCNNGSEQVNEGKNIKTARENEISEIGKPKQRAALQAADTHKIENKIKSKTNKSAENIKVTDEAIELVSMPCLGNNLKTEETEVGNKKQEGVATIKDNIEKNNIMEITDDSANGDKSKKIEKSDINSVVERSSVNRAVTNVTTAKPTENKQATQTNETKTEVKIIKTAPDDKIAVQSISTPKEPLQTNLHNSKQITCVENGKEESVEVKSGSKVTKLGSKPENNVGAVVNGEKKIGAGASLKSRSLVPPVSEPVKIGFAMLKSRPKNEPVKKKKKKTPDGDKKGVVETQMSVSIVSPSSEGEGTKKLPAVSPSKKTVVKKEKDTQKLDPVVTISQENKDLILEQCDREPSLKTDDAIILKKQSIEESKSCAITSATTSEKLNDSDSHSLINAEENSLNCNESHQNEINKTPTETSPTTSLPVLKSSELSEENNVKTEVALTNDDIPPQTITSSGGCEANKLCCELKPETVTNCIVLLEQETPVDNVDNNCAPTLTDNRAQIAKELIVEVLEKSTSEASISFAPISPNKQNKSLELLESQNEKYALSESKPQLALGDGSLNSEPSALPLEQSIVSPSHLEPCHSQGNIVKYELEKSTEVTTSLIEQRSLNHEPNISTLEVDTLPPQPPSGQGFGVVRANTGRKLEDDRYRTEVEVFFRAGALQQLECQRDERLQDRVTRLQARCRGYLARRRFAKRKVQEVAVRCIQRNVRRFLSVRDWPWWRLLIRVAPLLNVHRAEEELRTKTEELETLRAKLDKVETERTRLKQDTDRLEGRLSELSVALSEEHSAATLASERLEAETAERLRLQQELDHVQTRHGELQAASERLEMELLFCRAAEMNGTTEDEGECDEGASPQLRQRLERAHREIALAKRRLTQQHEDDLEQMLGLKKTMDKKLADAYEEVEEQRQVAAQWKRKAQRITSEGNDSRLLLEEHAARNALLEKRQRKFDADLQALQEALRQEKAQRERAQRERDLAAAEKASAEQNLVGCRLELEMREEKVASLSRELEELQFGGAAEEEVAALRKARHSLELKLKEQEEELDDLAGQVSLLEQAKLRLEMSLEQQRKETRREFSQRDEELEEVRANAHKKVKALESQLEAEHEERTRLLRERHELERRLTEAAEAARGRAPEDEQALARLRRDLRHTKALLRDAHTMLDKYKNEAPGKGQIRQLRHQLEDAEAARTAALRARQVAETELRETQATLEEASRARGEAEDRAAAAVRERTEARGQLEENEEEMAEVLRKYRAAVAQVSQEQAALQESAVQLQTLEAERNSLKEQLAELAARVESAEGETVSSLTQRRLEMKVRELESRLELEQTTRTRLETQISRLKDATEKLQSDGDAARTREAQAQEASRRLQRQLRELREAEAGHAAREADWARRRRELELRTEAADQEASTARTDLRLALQRVEDLQQAMAGELNSSASEEETEGESDSDESIESFLQQHRTPLRSTSHLTDTFELDFSCRSPEGQSDPGEPASSLADEIKTNESQA